MPFGATVSGAELSTPWSSVKSDDCPAALARSLNVMVCGAADALVANISIGTSSRDAIPASFMALPVEMDEGRIQHTA